MITDFETAKKLILDNLYPNGDWMKIGSLRDATYLQRQLFDEAITALTREGKVNLVPENNQKTLTDADRYNAVRFGAQDKHLAALDRG
jgi:hypothetical protein